MKEKPILFNGEMVRAVLDGRKTQTRRVIKPQPEFRFPGNGKRGMVYHKDRATGQVIGTVGFGSACEQWVFPKCPYGQPGDRLWVRETWGTAECYDHIKPSELCNHITARNIFLRAGDPKPVVVKKWRPSIFMPRWASRINLEITSVRMERVQEISEEDARAEGIIDGGCLNCGESEPCGCDNPEPDARDAFIWLWNSINEKRGYGWDANPWVWVVEFRVTI